MRRTRLAGLALAFALAAGCGGTPARTHGRSLTSAEARSEERGYLAARREERPCGALASASELEFGQKNQPIALDLTELLVAFCPQQKLHAMEKIMVMLAQPTAKSPAPRGPSVRIRFHPRLAPNERLYWMGAYADGQLGLSGLLPGIHRIDVDVHLWQENRAGEGQMIKLQQTVSVRVEERTPVVLDMRLERQQSSLIPLTIALTPGAPDPAPSPAASAQAAERRMELGSSDELVFPRPPTALAQAGLGTSVELELCLDSHGKVSRVTPLAWPHPRHLGAYIEGLRSWQLRPLMVGGVPTPFCTNWTQIVDPAQNVSQLR
jgi:hypothetical protein